MPGCLCVLKSNSSLLTAGLQRLHDVEQVPHHLWLQPVRHPSAALLPRALALHRGGALHLIRLIGRGKLGELQFSCDWALFPVVHPLPRQRHSQVVHRHTLVGVTGGPHVAEAVLLLLVAQKEGGRGVRGERKSHSARASWHKMCGYAHGGDAE